MTPEQETLADLLIRCRKLVAATREDMVVFGDLLPVDEDFDADEPGGNDRRLLKAFAKSFEQLQDHLSRELFRALVVVQAPHVLQGLSGKLLLTAIVEDAAALIGFDSALWSEFTTVRNSLAHDYLLNFHEAAPVLNRAWQILPDLLDIAERVDRFVTAKNLLDSRP